MRRNAITRLVHEKTAALTNYMPLQMSEKSENKEKDNYGEELLKQTEVIDPNVSHNMTDTTLQRVAVVTTQDAYLITLITSSCDTSSVYSQYLPSLALRN